MKVCFKCGLKKEHCQFYKHKKMTDGLLGKCKECTKKDSRKNYYDNLKEKQKYDRHRTRHNFRRIFQHRYSGMRQRISGAASRTYKVEGKKLMTRDEFMDWCYSKESMQQFTKLHEKWVASNFERRLAPSIDRIDNDLGYTLENIRWITMVENVRKYNH